ncbi:potassium channel subfamily K member 13-like [Megalops cyprinoides]|uniref:potassium channel subfamily K member 13-like n=1 Tax=Megalops cyprinoides TaxID=118141 RepID=UPI001863BD7A|nr:potassium channel subfamily K member 13-like [Megalops cyprinoides]
MACGCGVRGDGVHRRASLRLNEDNARFGLLASLLLLYLLCGAAVFSALERDPELRARRRWHERLANFSRQHGVTPQALRAFLRQYEEAHRAGVRVDPLCPRWDFPGAFYFAASVIATIGFGMTTPATTGAKIFLIVYGLLGCAATILFFNLFLERVITLLAHTMCWCHQRQLRCLVGWGRAGQRGSVGGKEDRLAGWKPSLYPTALILGAGALLIACGVSALYSSKEGWGYLESLYFSFVAFSTIGFGDLVSSQKEQHCAQWAYRLGNFLLILAGICCLYSLLNVVSILMKQALNWILRKLIRPCSGTPLGRLCCCCLPCRHGNHPHNLARPPSAGPRRSCNAVHPAPLTVPPGKPQCTGVFVETVCNSEMDVRSGRRLSGEMISVKDFLPSNKVTLAVKQKPDMASRGHIGFSEPLGALAVMSSRLQEMSIDQ